MSCPDEDSLVAFARGSRHADVEQHIESCAVCRTLVAELVKSRSEVDTWREGAAPAAMIETTLDSPVRAARKRLGAPRASIELSKGSRLGRYVVLERLGAGGMGLVYSAYDPQLDRKIAVKVLLEQTGDELESWRARLLREAQAMARLSHPNVLPVHDAGTIDGQVFVAMNLVVGGTLRGWVTAQKRSWREVVDKFVEAGRGLVAAHDAGLVHRDFKPENVLVGIDGRVQVTDFGLAVLSGSEAPVEPTRAPPDIDAVQALVTPLTRTGMFMGTPGYIAPEQYDGNADARSDQFSFCVSLYEALHGARPFAGKNVHELLTAMTRAPMLPQKSEVAPHVVEALLKGLAFRPERRHPTMAALLAALSGAPPRRTRWALGVAGLTAAAALAIVVGLIPSKAELDRLEEPPPRPVAPPATAPPPEVAIQVEVPPAPVPTPRPPTRHLKPQLAKPTPRPVVAKVETPASVHVIVPGAWADISIDGTHVGRTPSPPLSVEPGRHRVEISNPLKGSKTVVVELTPGESRELTVGFEE